MHNLSYNTLNTHADSCKSLAGFHLVARDLPPIRSIDIDRSSTTKTTTDTAYGDLI